MAKLFTDEFSGVFSYVEELCCIPVQRGKGGFWGYAGPGTREVEAQFQLQSPCVLVDE